MRKTSPIIRGIRLYRGWQVPVIACCIALAVAVGGQLIFPLLTRRVVDVAIPTGDIRMLLGLGALAAGFPIASFALNAGAIHGLTIVGLGVLRRFRLSLVERCLLWPLARWDDMRTGGVQSRIMMDASALQGLVTDTLPGLLRAALTLPTTLAILLALDARLTLWCLCLLPLYALPTAAFSQRVRDAWKQVAERHEDTMRSLQDAISGVRLLKALAIETTHLRRLEVPLSEQMMSHRRANRLSLLFHGANNLVGALLPAGLLVLGGVRVIRGETTLGTVIAFITYIQQLFGTITVIPSMYVQSRQQSAYLERVFEYMDERIEDFSGRPAPVLGHDRSIRFENVSFGYGRNGLVLDDISFEIRAGETVAIVGASGTGKSTIVSLALGLYRPESGRVTVFGNDISVVDLHQLRRYVGLVQQDTFLFDTTIRDNIACARPGATDAEVESAARSARIHEFIISLPDGYDTVAGERGVQLSAGQRQRVSIARALLSDPPLLILDEATSALDPTTEAEIQRELLSLIRERTCLMVTHRLSTIEHASTIIVLDGGRIAERGTHSELVATNGLYRELLASQGSGLSG